MRPLVIFRFCIIYIKVYKKPPKRWFFYFFTDQNKDHNQPIPVQPNIQLANRTRIISCLLLPVWRANQAGARTMTNTIAIAIMYLAVSKILIEPIIWSILFIWIIYHILRCCQVLLQFLTTDYISPYGLYET